MKPGIATIALIAVLSAGCAGRVSRAPALDVRYLPRADTLKVDARPSNDAALVLAWPLLETVALAEGDRELRISSWYSMFGQPGPVLRIVERRGRPATGQLVYLWRQPVPPYGESHPTACGDVVKSTRICAFVVNDSAIDWQAVAQKLDSLNAWTISSRCEDGRHVTDSGELLIVRLSAGRFDTYSCNAPQYRTQSAAGRAALALYEYFLSLAGRYDPSR